ncbi:MAG: tRNA epoxyqueuosine(34) reductase QueG [Moorellales bacterium]
MGREERPFSGVLIGMVSARPDTELATLLEERERQGLDPPFVRAEPALRADPRHCWPAVRTLVCVAILYPAGDGPAPTEGLWGQVARSFAGPDYHRRVRAELARWAERLAGAGAGCSRWQAWVDSVPVVERWLAHRAGLGFFGRNCCLIHPRLGSWFWLGELALDVDLDPRLLPEANSATGDCGSCRRCLEACPTGALRAPYVLDFRRCLSYWTQAKGIIPRPYRGLMGSRLMGCDTCQEVCPYNQQDRERPPGPSRWLPLGPLLGPGAKKLVAGTALAWRGTTVLARNAAVALGNSRRPEAVELLAPAVRHHPSPVVRAHAAWALGRLGTAAALRVLREAARRETEEMVQQEIRRALEDSG